MLRSLKMTLPLFKGRCRRQRGSGDVFSFSAEPLPYGSPYSRGTQTGGVAMGLEVWVERCSTRTDFKIKSYKMQ